MHSLYKRAYYESHSNKTQVRAGQVHRGAGQTILTVDIVDGVSFTIVVCSLHRLTTLSLSFTLR